MNIESANLSSLVPSSSGTGDSVSLPSTGGSISSEGFSGALVEQIGLLSNIKSEDSLPLQAPDIAGLQDVNGSQGIVAGLSAGKIDMQDFATLIGNDLPPSYKTKDDVDHEAALAAVTDTFRYITMGVTVGEKAVAAEQNMKDVTAMTIPVEQNVKGAVAAAVPAEQNMKDVIAMTIPVEQNVKSAVAAAVPAEQNMKDVIAMTIPVEPNVKGAVAAAVPVEQNTADVVAETEQGMKDAAVMNVPVQMDLKQGNDKQDKKQAAGETQITGIEDNSGTEGVLAAIILPAVMPVGQGKATDNLVSADAVKEGVLLSLKPSTGDAKLNQPARVSDNVLQSETVFRQPVQDKQDFNLKYFENTGQTEKAGRAGQQFLNLEGEKALPRVGADITQINRAVVDNKTDVPAITKPLTHPEWNKDLGERIVWMSSRAIPAAEIRLNPQHLGPISVRVDVADDQATVVFTAQHAATREALEASIPKLREMMGAQQLNLVDVNVSQGPASDQGRSQSQNFAQTADGREQGVAGAAVDGVDDVEQEIESGRAVVSKGLLSIYA